MLEILRENERPEWFQYPHNFLRVIDQNLIDLNPWYLMNRNQVLERMKGLRNRYPSRDLVPFARRDDNDDIACWPKDSPDAVILIHDFASPGYEQRAFFPDFWDWFRAAIEDMINFES